MSSFGVMTSTIPSLLLLLVAACSGAGATTSDGGAADVATSDAEGHIDAEVDATMDALPIPSGVPTAMTYVKASNHGGHFSVVALSGDSNTLVVGAPAESNASVGINGDETGNSAPFTGAAYVFVRSGGTWVQQAYLKSSNVSLGNKFGGSASVSGDGNTVIVGANAEDSIVANSGAAYVFTRSGVTWTEQVILKAPNPDTNDNFGQKVAVSADGQTVVVGAPDEASASAMINGNQLDDSAALAGAAYVFARNGSAWSFQAYLKASNTRAYGHFGSDVAVSADGNSIAVGSNFENGGAVGVGGDQTDTSAFRSGAAYVFTRVGSTWAQTAYVKASNPRASSNFGVALALSQNGSTLAVAASKDPSAATGIDGDQSNQSASAAGAAYVFVHNGTTWVQQAYVKASNTEAGDFFGESIAISATGDRLIVGAGGEDSAATGFGGNQQDNSLGLAGAAYVFGRTGASWSQLAYVKALNPQSADSFGSTYQGGNLAVSGDAKVYAVGSMFENGSTHGVGTTPNDEAGDSGAVYLLE